MLFQIVFLIICWNCCLIQSIDSNLMINPIQPLINFQQILLPCSSLAQHLGWPWFESPAIAGEQTHCFGLTSGQRHLCQSSFSCELYLRVILDQVGNVHLLFVLPFLHNSRSHLSIQLSDQDLPNNKSIIFDCKQHRNHVFDRIFYNFGKAK